MSALAYRAAWLGRRLMGRRQLLRLCLNGAWLLRRLAFELSGEMWAEQFHCQAMALSEDVLRRWIPEGGSVLDLGCGTGRWCRAVAPLAGVVVGLDRDPQHIEEARRLSGPPHLSYLVADVTGELASQLANMRFDVVLLVHVLEHVDDGDCLLLALRHLAFTLVVEVPDFSTDPLNLVRHRLRCPFYSDADHVREYTLASLGAQLARTGWELIAHQQRGGAVLAVARAPMEPALSPTRPLPLA